MITLARTVAKVCPPGCRLAAGVAVAAPIGYITAGFALRLESRDVRSIMRLHQIQKQPTDRMQNDASEQTYDGDRCH